MNSILDTPRELTDDEFAALRAKYRKEKRFGNKWLCDICDRWFDWSDDSSWFGSIRHLDEARFDKMTICCSIACENELRSRKPLAKPIRKAAGGRQ